MSYQVLHVSVITISDSKKGYRIIQDRQTLFHSSIKSNVAIRILKAVAEPTKKYSRTK